MKTKVKLILVIALLLLVGCQNYQKVCRIEGCNNDIAYEDEKLCSIHGYIEKERNKLISDIKSHLNNYPIDSMGKDPVWFTDIGNWPSIKTSLLKVEPDDFKNGEIVMYGEPRQNEWLVMSDNGSQAVLITKYCLTAMELNGNWDDKKKFENIKALDYMNGVELKMGPTKNIIDKLNWDYIDNNDDICKASTTFIYSWTDKTRGKKGKYWLTDSFKGQSPNLDEFIKRERDQAKRDIAEARKGMKLTQAEIDDIYRYAEENAREDYQQALANVDKQYYIDKSGELNFVTKKTKDSMSVRPMLIVTYDNQ